MSECKFCDVELARIEDDECQECHDIWVWVCANPSPLHRMVTILTNQQLTKE